MAHILDRPIWHALRGPQARFAEGQGKAVRYAPDVAPFAAAENDGPEAQEALARLVASESPVILLQAGTPSAPPGVKIVSVAQGLQFVGKLSAAPKDESDAVQLDDSDAPAMRALAGLTKPGPFLERTHHLGTFFGIKIDGELVAMAGERMKLPGFAEVSAVCTHPSHRGRGYAAALSRLIAARIAARGEIPFLHAYAANTPALRLYEALGFTCRSEMSVTVLAR